MSASEKPSGQTTLEAGGTSSTKVAADTKSQPRIRTVIQRCEHAILKVQRDVTGAQDGEQSVGVSAATDYELREIGRGLIVFVCFYKGATLADVEKLWNSISTLNICERPVDDQAQTAKSGKEKLVNLFDLPGDLLVIPQATLSGKPKSTSMQYHGLIDKQTGSTLYQSLITICEEAFGKSGAAQRGNKVLHGEYGARQILSTETNGPFTHVLDL